MRSHTGWNTRWIQLLLLVWFAGSCQPAEEKTEPPTSSILIANMTEEKVDAMRWMNAPESYVVANKTLHVTVDKGTDFFNNPEDSSVVGTAPLLYQEVEGDFVVKALVQPDFSDQWNAVALMLHIDSLNWIKFAFENSDATGPSIVTVVTKGTSDDANGVLLNAQPMVWLALVRKGSIYSMHWSVDGESYQMARLTSMANQPSVKVGIEAQSPVGARATHQIHSFELVARTVSNLRNLNE